MESDENERLHPRRFDAQPPSHGRCGSTAVAPLPQQRTWPPSSCRIPTAAPLRNMGALQRNSFLIRKRLPLALRPALPVADRPSLRFDPPVQVEAFRLLRDLADQDDLSVLLNTHDGVAAAAMADAVMALPRMAAIAAER